MLLEVVAAFVAGDEAILDGATWAAVYATEAYGTVAMPLRTVVVADGDVAHGADGGTCATAVAQVGIGCEMLVAHHVSHEKWTYDA